MMSKPAHKQDNPKYAPGQWVNVDLKDQTLEDYIRRKQLQDAFDAVAQEKKMTFHKWWAENGRFLQGHFYQVESIAESAWKAAQENK